MRSASPAVIALLATGDYVAPDLWTIVLSGGVVVRWTSGEDDIVSAGQTFKKAAVTRGAISEKRGTEASTLDMFITATAELDSINGQPVIPFIRRHGLDGASVILERAIAPDWETMAESGPTGTYIRFSGLVTAVGDVTGATAQVTISDWRVRLGVMMPRNVYQAACMHTVYDSGCTLVDTAFQATGTVVGSAGATLVFGSSLTPVLNDYALGRILFTSGANAGVSTTVRSNDGAGNITLVLPLPNALAPGDAFTIFPGCDLTRARCSSRFNNLLNYKGTDFVPQPQTPLGSQSTTTTTHSGKG